MTLSVHDQFLPSAPLPQLFLDFIFQSRSTKLKLNFVSLARKQTIPTELSPLVGEVSANFADRGCRVVSATDRKAVNLGFLDPKPLLFQLSSSSVILTRLSEPRSRPTTSQEIW
jgi:hypothetical protein